MNKSIDYSKYNISSTTQFDNGLAKLKSDGNTEEIKKLFRIIDEIIIGLDMNDLEYARPLENSDKMQHIHLDGRKTGNIILIYRTDGKNIELDLKLYNITDHKNLNRKSSKDFTKRQQLFDFSVIENKYSQEQIEYAENAYMDLISDYKFYRNFGESRKSYTEKFLQDYFESYECSKPLDYIDFINIIYYIENKHKKSIFGSISPDDPQKTYPITKNEERYIIELIQDYEIDIYDAYIETEVDGYGDTYESMFVSVYSDDYRLSKIMESDFYELESQFGILFESEFNGLGKYGKIYEFYHYFE